MFRQWAAAHVDDDATERSDGLAALADVLRRSRDHIRMHVAIGDVAPHRKIELAIRKQPAALAHHVAEAIEWHDHVSRRLRNSGIALPGLRHSAIDSRR